jgi:L-threonylcarbamoyladenylate synthase
MSITRKIRIPSRHGEQREAAFDALIRILRGGGVIAYPTETVYGLGCLAFDAAAVMRIHRLKGGASGRSFILLIPSPLWLERLSTGGKAASSLAARFWPGPLTLVLQAAPGVPGHLLGEGGTVALRCSSSAFVTSLLRRVPEPVISTSANPEGCPPPASSEAVGRYFARSEEAVDALVVCSDLMGGCPSTVVRILGGEIGFLRDGPIAKAEIRHALVDLPRGAGEDPVP